ncbi:MAG: sigma-54 dependent transcriptional regulator [Myxococcota bacterium]|nr:sigma-54 dependent transcriptional regulator [Myxococcota bacterium]
MNEACTVLVADADGALHRLVLEALRKEDATVLEAHDVSGALETLDGCAADVLITDSLLPQRHALDLLSCVQQRWPTLPVLLVTDQASTIDIAEAIGAGANDVLVRPVAPSQLSFAVHKALIVARRGAPAPPPPRVDADIVFGQSPAMKALRELVQQVSPTSSTVLVRGESGTGKELIARALHRLSRRASRPFIKIDCTSLPETLIESELFGYEKGAFTGATAQKEGRVQLADGGTLFLDEIGELSAPVQAKLLRLLQDREIERLGGKKTIQVDVRVVAATHRDLETMVAHGTFRQDLFYRLNVVPLWIAPLRARRGDIEELAEHFCAQVPGVIGKPGARLSAEALRLLAGQRWPGNVRQLQNFVERLVVLCTGSSVSAADVEAELAGPVRFATESGLAGADAVPAPISTGHVVPLDEALRAAEREALRRALEHSAGNRSRAARLLGVSRSTLYSKLQEHGLM